jgi:hypothetical protein
VSQVTKVLAAALTLHRLYLTTGVAAISLDRLKAKTFGQHFIMSEILAEHEPIDVRMFAVTAHDTKVHPQQNRQLNRVVALSLKRLRGSVFVSCSLDNRSFTLPGQLSRRASVSHSYVNLIPLRARWVGAIGCRRGPATRLDVVAFESANQTAGYAWTPSHDVL